MWLVKSALVLLGAASGATAFFDGYLNASATEPLQIRLAFQGPTAMMVSWNTFQQLSHPTVKFGLEPFFLYRSASSDVSVTYPTSLTYNNHVNLTHLIPGATYFYLPEGSKSKHPYSFQMPKLAGDHSPFSVALVADMGTFGPLGLSTTTGVGAANPLMPGEQTTIQSIVKQLDSVAFAIHGGDLAYADAWLKEEIQQYLPTTTIAEGAQVYEHILNAFYDELVPITSRKPYMVSGGNHEANCDNGGTTNKTSGQAFTEAICMEGQRNFTGYRNHFRMPSGPSGGLENFWYSYDYGMVHFVSIDTETDLGNGLVGPDEGKPEFSGPFGAPNQQIDWLVNDLKKVNRKKTPWVIVIGHRPFYASTSGVCANCVTAFEDIFHQYGVDLYFSGHSHVYERSAPTYKGVADPKELQNPSSTWYILNGAAGHYDGLDTLNDPLTPYSRFAEDTLYAWSKLIVHNCTHLTQQGISSKTGKVFDQATLVKHRKCHGHKFGWYET